MREVVISFRQTFKDAHNNISKLGKYKVLHDDLQELEEPHQQIYLMYIGKRQLEWRELSFYIKELTRIIRFKITKHLEDVANDDRFNKGADLKEKLERAIHELDQAVLKGERENLRNPITDVKNILANLSFLNTLIVLTVKNLNFPSLGQALNDILKKLEQESLDKENQKRKDIIKDSITNLYQLSTNISKLIETHDLFQAIDDILRTIENGKPDYIIEAMSREWKFLKGHLEQIFANDLHECEYLKMLKSELDSIFKLKQDLSEVRSKAKKWSMVFFLEKVHLFSIKLKVILYKFFCRKKMKHMTTSQLRPDSKEIMNVFRTFRSEIGKEFKRVDKELLDLCNQLPNASHALALLLTEIEEA